MNQTSNADSLRVLRRRVAAHEAAHVVVASQFSGIRISGVTITTQAAAPKLSGLTSYTSPDTTAGLFMTLLVCCAGTCGETVLLGSAQPERTAVDDLERISELAVKLSQYSQLVARWVAGLAPTQLDQVGRLLPHLSRVQLGIVAVGYQRAMSMINANRTAVDIISSLLMSRDSLTSEQLQKGLQAARAS